MRLLLFRLLTFTLCLLTLALPFALADQVIMKDGTHYKGKIMIDSDKAILIGNPPFDPNSYLLQSEDVEKIIYEEYHPNSPAERKRGLTFESRLSGNVFSSDQLPARTAPALYTGLGFRVHPLFEINGGVDWAPSMHAQNAFSVSDGTTTRRYEDFWQYSAVFSSRFYPFYAKAWKTEPYLTAGYSWSRLTPKDSGDHLKGTGWHIGLGAIRPVTRHLFIEGRFVFEKRAYDTISYLGREGSIQPHIDQRVFSFSAGASYRL